MTGSQAIKIVVAISFGRFPGPDAPVEFLWYWAHAWQAWRVIHLKRSGDLAGAGPWEESTFTLGKDDADAVDASLAEMGIPGRALDVHGVPDTGGRQLNISLHIITADGRAFHQDLGAQCSGVEGTDAEAFCKLLTRLFALVGVQK